MLESILRCHLRSTSLLVPDESLDHILGAYNSVKDLRYPLKVMGKRVSKCLGHKSPWVKECLYTQVRLHVASTWFELPFCPLIYVL